MKIFEKDTRSEYQKRFPDVKLKLLIASCVSIARNQIDLTDKQCVDLIFEMHALGMLVSSKMKEKNEDTSD